jgi:hypothetical protein
MTNKPATMVSVYDGAQCRGFVLQRRWSGGYAVGYEAFDANETSLGVFGSQAEAVAEVRHRAHEPSEEEVAP